MSQEQKQFFTTVIVVTVVISLAVGFFAGAFGANYFSGIIGAKNSTLSESVKISSTQEEQIVKVAQEASPAVVSIIVTKDLPVMERYQRQYDPFGDFFDNFFGPFNFQTPEYRQNGTQKQEIGGGSGFIITSDGLILSNRHVVEDEEADYTVLTNDGQRYAAQVLARDPVQDIAILKIDEKSLPVLTLGDSDDLKSGQSVIAIGNALGEFRNTLSVGVISGLKRSIAASSGFGAPAEELENVIQTDAAINPGNSGGPLLNLSGQVIGINVAVARDAQNIGFALPINLAKRDIEQVRATGKISYPFLGVRYVSVTPELKDQNNLPVDYGALLVRGNLVGEPAVTPDSPADKAGLQENDIILEADGQKITPDNTLAQLIQKHNVGDILTLKILHDGQERTIRVAIGER